MLKIRLKRIGKRGEPHYRIVVIPSTSNRSSKAIAEVGYYNPRTNPSTFTIEKEKVEEWLKKGAQPTETVAHFLIKNGIMKKLKKGSTLSKGRAKKKNADSANS
ncbi:MAG: 30S ribosomal protein S16 [candidate division WS6 bacterium GW2011_GWF2_39_15]|uniref:Small ribosomal subunit protein bS16 n=1 Tax=candidate division WS6 bacterium GW2011_GWF2_39_15 TaxID=1619100 RepID=A0A0G0MQA2_9BACT|nr:MAG: 30S ribosomal protein S16 [candidate division WS6 bacterium GW2011_GWF2_39_15]